MPYVIPRYTMYLEWDKENLIKHILKLEHEARDAEELQYQNSSLRGENKRLKIAIKEAWAEREEIESGYEQLKTKHHKALDTIQLLKNQISELTTWDVLDEKDTVTYEDAAS
jgi:FtsZ-binding cell division protein ZapB